MTWLLLGTKSLISLADVWDGDSLGTVIFLDTRVITDLDIIVSFLGLLTMRVRYYLPTTDARGPWPAMDMADDNREVST